MVFPVLVQFLPSVPTAGPEAMSLEELGNATVYTHDDSAVGDLIMTG